MGSQVKVYSAMNVEEKAEWHVRNGCAGHPKLGEFKDTWTANVAQVLRWRDELAQWQKDPSSGAAVVRPAADLDGEAWSTMFRNMNMTDHGAYADSQALVRDTLYPTIRTLLEAGFAGELWAKDDAGGKCLKKLLSSLYYILNAGFSGSTELKFYQDAARRGQTRGKAIVDDFLAAAIKADTPGWAALRGLPKAVRTDAEGKVWCQLDLLNETTLSKACGGATVGEAPWEKDAGQKAWKRLMYTPDQILPLHGAALAKPFAAAVTSALPAELKKQAVVKPGPPKTNDRVRSKWDEYQSEAEKQPDLPRWAHLAAIAKEHDAGGGFYFAVNDFVRCSVTCPTAVALLAAHGALVKAFHVVSSKNGFHPDSAPSASGYRDAKLIVRFEAAGKDVDYVGAAEHESSLSEGYLSPLLGVSDEDVKAKRFGDRFPPLAMLCEIQLVHQQWLNVKKSTSFGYKALRATTWSKLIYEFTKYRTR